MRMNNINTDVRTTRFVEITRDWIGIDEQLNHTVLLLLLFCFSGRKSI